MKGGSRARIKTMRSKQQPAYLNEFEFVLTQRSKQSLFVPVPQGQHENRPGKVSQLGEAETLKFFMGLRICVRRRWRCSRQPCFSATSQLIRHNHSSANFLQAAPVSTRIDEYQVGQRQDILCADPSLRKF